MAAARSGADARQGLPWTGVMTESDISKLKQEFRSIVICPGFCGDFGKAADESGIIYAPGAAIGLKAARRHLRVWQKKIVEDERYNWWPGKAQQAGATIITVSDVLTGVHESEWKTYRDRYRNIRENRSRSRLLDKTRTEVKKSYGEKRSAAIVLTELQGGSD